MGRSVRWRAFALVLVLCCLAGSAFAQQGGSLSGVVRDAQQALLPGVTVTVASEALIGGSRTAVTGDSGAYLFGNLPPGTYSVAYELTGFAPLKHEDVRVQVAAVTRLDVSMSLGSVQETVTVSGESPVVDVSSTVSQTNIDKELYDAIPTGRNPWVMAGLVPGVVTGRLDVGGTEGMQQYNIEAFGSADSQKSFSIDGLKTNWPGNTGGATMMYYGFEMYEEYNMQTASGTAESDVAGVYMNMVTKSGGNRYSGEHNLYFMNDALQGNNIDDDLRSRLGLQPGQQTGAAGNPIDISYDWSSTLGGPIIRDKAWFFGALRWWRLDQLQIGAQNPDGSQAIDDNRIRNVMGKATYQFDAATKASFLFNRNLKDRFHRRDSPYLFVEDKATTLQDQPAQNFVVQANRVFGRTLVGDVRFGRMWGTTPQRYQPEVGPNDFAIRDNVRFTRINAAEQNQLNPNHRYQFNATANYYNDTLVTGTHDFRFGLQFSRERMAYLRNRNGDILFELRDGVPNQAFLSNTPIDSDHRLNTWAFFAQDQWRVNRFTVNAGLRFDAVNGYLPAQASPAGRWVGERSFDQLDDVIDFPLNIALRLGATYDLFGTGKTALKGYYGRFYNQFGSEILEAVNPNAFVQQAVSWDGTNLGAFAGFPRGLFPRSDPDAKRPYSDEFNVEINHELMPNLAASVGYHGRYHRNGLGPVDIARPPSAYNPETRNYTDPLNGPQSITIFVLDPSFVLLRDRVITNVDILESDYSGVSFEVVKRMSNRWQMLAGLTVQKHEGFDHNGTYTIPTETREFNNPNVNLNRETGSVLTEVPWLFTLSGSYLLPWYDIQVSGKYTARDGDPLLRTFTFTGLTTTQVSEIIRVVPRGTDRTETVNAFVDLRVGKQFRLGPARLEGTFDIFNLMNENTVLLQTEAIGTTFGRPTRILAPRIIRFGITARF